MKTVKKSISSIREELFTSASKNLKAYKSSHYLFHTPPPPDILAILDQLNEIDKLVEVTYLPITLIRTISSKLASDKDSTTSALGMVLLQCINDIRLLEKFCEDLKTKSVEYDVPDTDNAE